jgi:hypothetical protein
LFAGNAGALLAYRSSSPSFCSIDGYHSGCACRICRLLIAKGEYLAKSDFADRESCDPRVAMIFIETR